ncbi:hypothetical protein CU097_014749 [Rhizopus azygosporus]|uniref:Uncharacterized protein n=1 Tax=Rhizopus azygosporus TaxID=86630 RepID=A0A367KC85_RHIAZ|nr:hypothetical protein CU097_014749 [Rhizopus azygosporus]
MKSLTLLAVAAVTCAFAADIHHGGLDHLNHDLVGHDHDRDHDKEHRHGYLPPNSSPIDEQPDVEIVDKPPVVMFETITRTKPWVVVSDHRPTDKPEPEEDTDDPTNSTPAYDDDDVEEDDDDKGNYGGRRNHDKGHDRDHRDGKHHKDHDIFGHHDKDYRRARQKAYAQNNLHANSVASEAAEAPEVERMAAAAVSASAVTSAVRSAISSKISSATATSTQTSASSGNNSTSGAAIPRSGGAFVAAAAGIAAWFLL